MGRQCQDGGGSHVGPRLQIRTCSDAAEPVVPDQSSATEPEMVIGQLGQWEEMNGAPIQVIDRGCDARPRTQRLTTLLETRSPRLYRLSFANGLRLPDTT
jgi:hypothetical protein